MARKALLISAKDNVATALTNLVPDEVVKLDQTRITIREPIRGAIESLGIPHRKASRYGIVTISVGVTSTVPERSTTPETFLVAADRAMYTAKHDGKNQVAYSTPAQTGLFQSLCVTGDMVSRPS